MYSSEEIGFRTKKVVGLVQDQIKQLKEDILDDEAEKLAIKALENAGLKIKNPESGTDALIFMSEGQARALAELILASDTDKKNYKNALKDHPSFDMALFGRMVAPHRWRHRLRSTDLESPPQRGSGNSSAPCVRFPCWGRWQTG